MSPPGGFTPGSGRNIFLRGGGGDMRPVDLVGQETGEDSSNIMLLRHSTRIVEKLLAAGGLLEEYTNTQPTGSRYDFLAAGRPPISVVVEIFRDRVSCVYRVQGVEAEGTILSLV